jgi:hypothetical protein
MQALADDLSRTVETAVNPLRALGDARAAQPRLSGGWSPKQIIGHLVDSASNNHQRFVRAALQESLEFPAYDQNGCVRVAAVNEIPWEDLLNLWAGYNGYLAHLIAHLPEEALERPCTIGTHEPVTLRFLATDYVRHLRHHLGQIIVE